MTSGQLLNNIEYLKQAYEGNDRCYQFAQTRYKGTKLIDNGIYVQASDYQSEYYNVSNGIRYTCFQPEQYRLNVRIYGSCIARGFGVSDEYTISSMLQSKLNQEYPETIRVLNYGTGGKAGYEGIINDLLYIMNTRFERNDVVVLVIYHTFSSRVFRKALSGRYNECSHLFDAPHDFGWWFLNSTIHLNAVGNQVIADYIYATVQEKLVENLKQCNPYDGKNIRCKYSKSGGQLCYEDNQDLQQYMEYISRYRVESQEIIGSIVMNCNPFTLGHKYLIEQACKSVDHLFVFVVEENKSFFPFEERYAMVFDGVREFTNVTVLRSGKFMISSLTFPEYFEKEENNDVMIDATNDLSIFGSRIAPVLNITVRFAGEEPTDLVTRQYNTAMKEQLGQYGIQFVCIPRLESEGSCISASVVRKRMKEHDTEAIQRLVPATTYDRIKKYMK